MRGKVTACIFLTLACGWSASSPAQQAASGPTVAAQPAPATVTPRIPAVDAAVVPFVERGEVAGVVTLVAHQGRIVHLGAVGQSDIGSQRPLRVSDGFSIASMTKPIVVTAMMTLVSEGQLDLDDPVSKYLPSFAAIKLKNGQPPARPIRVRDVVTHTAGLTGLQIFRGSLSDHVEQLAARPLGFEPGSRWEYSPGINVAGRIVEIVSGQPLATFLQQRLFDPLQMTRTTFYPDESERSQLAKIYRPGSDGGPLVEVNNFISDFDPDNGPNPSGGLASTAGDLFRFYQMVLNGGALDGHRILPQQAVTAMTSVQTGDLTTGFTPGNGWGLGWCIVRQPQGVTSMLSPGSFGHGGAFGTQGWIDPQTDTIYLLLIQRAAMDNSDASEIRRVFQQTVADSLGR